MLSVMHRGGLIQYTVQSAVQAREKSQHNTHPTHGAGSQEVKQAMEKYYLAS